MNETERKEIMKSFITCWYQHNPNGVDEKTVRMVETILEKLPVYEFSIFLTPNQFYKSDRPFIKDVIRRAKNLVMRSDEKSKKALVRSFIYGYISEHNISEDQSKMCGWKIDYIISILDIAPSVTEFWRWCEHYFRGVPRVILGCDLDNPFSQDIARFFERYLPGFGEELCDYCKAFIH